MPRAERFRFVVASDDVLGTCHVETSTVPVPLHRSWGEAIESRPCLRTDLIPVSAHLGEAGESRLSEWAVPDETHPSGRVAVLGFDFVLGAVVVVMSCAVYFVVFVLVVSYGVLSVNHQ